jgi:hypothetical protein
MSYHNYEPMNSSERWKTVGLVVAAIVVVIVIIFGGWRLGWWFKAADVQMQRDTNVQSQQYQDGLISQERDRALAYVKATDPSQKEFYKSQFCGVYADIVNPPNDLQDSYVLLGCGSK